MSRYSSPGVVDRLEMVLRVDWPDDRRPVRVASDLHRFATVVLPTFERSMSGQRSPLVHLLVARFLAFHGALWSRLEAAGVAVRVSVGVTLQGAPQTGYTKRLATPAVSAERMSKLDR